MTPGYNPLCIKAVRGDRPATLASYTNGQWIVVPRGREQLLPGKTDGEVQEALNAGL